MLEHIDFVGVVRPLLLEFLLVLIGFEKPGIAFASQNLVVAHSQQQSSHLGECFFRDVEVT